MAYDGRTEVLSGLTRPNGMQPVPLVDASDIYVADDDSIKGYQSLSEKITSIDNDIETLEQEVGGSVDQKIEDAINALNATVSVQNTKKFVTGITQENGKINSVSEKQPGISDVDGLEAALNSKQSTISAGTGISISNNAVAITDEVNQNVVGTTGYTDLGTTLGITYSSEHKMETVLDNLASRSVNCDTRIGTLEYNGFSVSNVKTSKTEAEKGDTVTSTTISWNITIPSLPGTTVNPARQKIDNMTVDASIRQKELTGLSITTNTTWKVYAYLSATDDNLVKSATSNQLTFKNKMYYGTAVPPSNNQYTDTFIKALYSNKYVSSIGDCKGTYTVNASSGQYVYFAIPDEYPDPIIKYGGIAVEFAKYTSSYTNKTYNTTYKIFMSPGSGGGSMNYELTV